MATSDKHSRDIKEENATGNKSRTEWIAANCSGCGTAIYITVNAPRVCGDCMQRLVDNLNKGKQQ